MYCVLCIWPFSCVTGAHFVRYGFRSIRFSWLASSTGKRVNVWQMELERVFDVPLQIRAWEQSVSTNLVHAGIFI